MLPFTTKNHGPATAAPPNSTVATGKCLIKHVKTRLAPSTQEHYEQFMDK